MLKGTQILEAYLLLRQCFEGSFVMFKKCGGEQQTWRESDIGDDVLAVVEGYQVLQGVCVHNEEAAVIQAHRQGFAIRGEAAATATCGG